MNFHNNVTRLLDSRRIAYRVHTYDYDAGVHSALEVAEAIGLPPEQVLKTLVVLSGNPRAKPMLVVVPGPLTLDVRALAAVVSEKKVRMASHDQAERLTGLQTGGISPLALINRGFRIYIDDRAQRFVTVAVSAGERGANVELPVADLIRLTRAHLVRLAEGD